MRTAKQITVADLPNGFKARANPNRGSSAEWYERKTSASHVRVVQEGEEGLSVYSFDQYGAMDWKATFYYYTPADVVLAAIAKACE